MIPADTQDPQRPDRPSTADGPAALTAHVGHWRLELPAERRTWSTEVFRIFGLDPSGGPLSFEGSLARLHPDDRERVRADVLETFATGSDLALAMRVVRPDGDVREVLVRGTREALDDGHSSALIGVIIDVTDANRMRDDLRMSEARYRLLADNATDMIAQLDVDGRRLYVSPASRDLLGYEPAELIGTRPVDAMHPDDVPVFKAMVAGLATGERARAVSVNRLRHRDGRWIWVEASLHALFDGQGAWTGFLAAVRNITDRHLAEEALRESQEHYRVLADCLPQMVWIIDSTTRDTIYANHRFRAYYGPTGLGFADRLGRYHPEDAARIDLAWQTGRATGRSQEADARLMRHDGIFRWHKLIVVPIHRGGEVAGWVGTALDIHDFVIARQALVESADLLRIAQEAAGAGTWDMDLRMGLIILSPESAAMHGLPNTAPVTLTAGQWSSIAHPEDVPRVWAEVERAVKAREIYSSEFRVPLADGETRWVHGIGRAYFDAQGVAIRMIGLNFDVDKRKMVEVALVEASTAAETARREAEKASAAKTDFLASMSHEIRTPLNSILGYTELLRETAHHRPDDLAKLDRILGAGQALLTIVNDVLDFSKVEAGRVELDPQPFAPAALVADTMSMIRPLANDRSLVLRAELDPQLPARLMGDQNRLRQVLLNLMNNAVKFTPAGEVSLAIRQERRSGRDIHLRCMVSDTGIGIPADKRDLLFQRFSQIDGSISRRFGGTGLGLAISKSLIDLMGGAIGVESRDGVGSTFWFTLVLPMAEDVPANLGEGAPRPAEAGAHILLVEDVAMNQEIARAVLTSVGHRVDIASDGAQAVQAVQQTVYDVVLMDVQMPVMDGLEATRRIRGLGGRFGDLPILALTANVLPEQVARFRQAGMVDHVGKPFRKDDLLAAVARWWVTVRETPAEAGPVAPEILDRTVVASLADLLGAETLGRLLRELGSAVASTFPLDAARPDAARQIATSAHALVSSAGMLGFTALSDTCRRLEAAALAGFIARAELDEAEEAARQALAAIQALVAEGAAAPS